MPGLFFIFSVILSTLLLETHTGASIEEPKVEYSADSMTTVNDMKMRAKVFHAPGMERREQVAGDTERIIIMRMDRGVVYVLMPEERKYMEQSVQTMPGAMDPAEMEMERTPAGADIINGKPAKKSRIRAKGPQGASFEGFLWETDEGIIIKMDAVTVNGGQEMRFVTELENLRIGLQDRRLFEVPEGYVKAQGPVVERGMDMRRFGQEKTPPGGAERKRSPNGVGGHLPDIDPPIVPVPPEISEPGPMLENWENRGE